MKILKTNKKLAIEKFIKELLIIYILIILCAVLFAWFFDKYLEALFFCIAHIFLRNNFNKQYHVSKNLLCMNITIIIIFFGILLTLPLSKSLISSIPIAFSICLLGNELAVDKKTIYQMSESELRFHCKNNRILGNMQEYVIYKVFGYKNRELKGSELAQYIGCGLSSLEYYSKKTRKLLGIKKWE